MHLASSHRTIPALLEAQARAIGGRPALVAGAVELTYRELRDAAASYASTLAEAGIEPGDRVAVMSENRWEPLAIWLGCAWLGAVAVPINSAARGAPLEDLLKDSGPRIVAVEPTVVDRILECARDVAAVEHIWIIGGTYEGATDSRLAPFPAPGAARHATTVSPGDTLAILYTSGTTGPSKGVMCPHAQFYWWAAGVGEMLELTAADTLYTCLPLYHTNALNAFVQSLLAGAQFVLGPRFSASRFWERLIESDATVTYLLGAMISIVAGRDPCDHDRAHRVRIALAPATPRGLHLEFERRFGVRLVEAFGMTETNAVIGPRDGERRLGYMGRVMPGFEARVVDANDSEVPRGTPGELVVRADEPFAFATGYWRKPEETVLAWRNLWFHSGDRVVQEADGYFQFLDRLKDAIRRRGENISAWEVEQVLLQHPDVAAVAVIPVSSDLGEDDVMACVVLRQGAGPNPLELIRFCETRLAYYAVPRYIDFVAELPLTENGKVRKFALRDRGVTLTTWDREVTGVEPLR